VPGAVADGEYAVQDVRAAQRGAHGREAGHRDRPWRRPRKGRPAACSAASSPPRKVVAVAVLTNREIAAKMFMAEKTVKNYVSSLLAKVGPERLTQAAVLGTYVFSSGSRVVRACSVCLTCG
jgi:two-component system response regulator DevR